MNKPQVGILALGAAMVALVLSAPAMRSDDAGHPNWGEWSLVAETEGQARVLDFNLSRSDCETVADLFIANEGKPGWASFEVLYCEREG
jgi:hypothetical protein